MSPFSRSALYFSVIIFSSTLRAAPIATVTSAEPFAIDGHSVTTPGVSSFPVVIGDTVSTRTGPAVVLFSDGSAVKLGTNSSVRIAGAQFKPKVVLLAGALDFSISPGSPVSVTNLSAEHESSGGTASPVTAQSEVPSASQSVYADYVGEDSHTAGNWKGKYGADGQLIPSDVTNPPPYAHVTVEKSAVHALAFDAGDQRALQSNSGATQRVVSAYANNPTIDLNVTDGQMHSVTFYLGDFDNAGRSETITITDAATGKVLSSQTFSGFTGGLYETWNIKGHVQVHAASTTRGSAIVNGIFFDAPAAALGVNPLAAKTGAAAANASRSLLTNPKFLVPVGAASAAGVAAGLLALPPVSRHL